MKLYLEKVDVEPERGWPRLVRWRRRSYRVEVVMDFWVSQTGWWGREEKRSYLRLSTDRGMMEIYRSGVAWILSRLTD